MGEAYTIQIYSFKKKIKKALKACTHPIKLYKIKLYKIIFIIL